MAALMRTFIALVLLASVARADSWPDLSTPSMQGGGDGDGAVIVGVEAYASVPSVPGAAQSARDWYAYLTRARGVPPASTTLLLDGDGTRERIQKSVAVAARSVRSGGTLWIVFIGHGAPARDGRDGLLVGFDAQAGADSIEARSVAQRELATLAAGGKQSHIVLVADACFSGRTRDGTPIVPGLQPLVPVRFAPPPARMTILSASRADQVAGQLPRLARPAFSYLLLGALRGWGDGNGDGQVTAREAIAYTRDALRAIVVDRTQTPEIAGTPDVVLATKASEKAPNLGDVVLGSRSGAAPALSGIWRVRWSNTFGESGENDLHLFSIDGKLSGDWDGSKLLQPRVSGAELAWEERAEENGCRRYTISLVFHGERAAGHYVADNRCRATPLVYGGTMLAQRVLALPLAARWKGTYRNTLGQEGATRLVLRETAGGISGDWDGLTVEEARREGRTLTFVHHHGSCRIYRVTVELTGSGGTGTYRADESCGAAPYSGTFQLGPPEAP